MTTQNVSLKCMTVKNFSVKIPRWHTAAILKIETEISHDDAQRIGRPP